MNLPKHKNWIKKLGGLKSYSYELTELNNENRYLFASKFDDGINILVLEFNEISGESDELDSAKLYFYEDDFELSFNEQCDEFAEIWDL